jgi:NAD(P)-dependent dehydrogenase (short-subunit alcohol dehydrogenase family)
MKIILIGAAGTLGRAVQQALAPRHDLIRAGRQGADVQVDITQLTSIQAMFERTGPVDAVVAAAGQLHFGSLGDFTEAQYAIGLNDKLMGQVRLVMAGQHVLRDGGSFTLVSGVLSHDPIPWGSSASMVNGALESFVQAAAIELPRGQRINAVSPTLFVESSEAYGPYFPGFKPVPVADAARAIVKSVEGRQTGQVYLVV